jgi:hypothetical protein
MAKETSGDVVVRYSITIGSAIFIMLIVMVGILMISSMGFTGLLIKWLLLPIISYCISFGFNALLQNIQCNKVNIGQIAKVTVFTPAVIIAGILIVDYVPFLLYPIRAAMVGFSDNAIKMVGTSFIIFWAAYYAQILEASLSLVCKST